MCCLFAYDTHVETIVEVYPGFKYYLGTPQVSWIQASYAKSMCGCNESMILLGIKRCPPVLPLEGFKEKIPKEAHDECVWHQFLLAAAKTRFAFTHWGVGPKSFL
jgi:hypothetical protein